MSFAAVVHSAVSDRNSASILQRYPGAGDGDRKCRIDVFRLSLVQDTGRATSYAEMMAVVVVLALMFATYIGGFTVGLSELFPTNVRCSGFSMSYQLSCAVFGGTAMATSTLCSFTRAQPLTCSLRSKHAKRQLRLVCEPERLCDQGGD